MKKWKEIKKSLDVSLCRRYNIDKEKARKAAYPLVFKNLMLYSISRH